MRYTLLFYSMRSPAFEFEIDELMNVTKWIPLFVVNHINELGNSALVVGAETELMERVCPTATILLEENTTWQILSAKIEELRPSLVVFDLCFPYLRDPIHKKMLAYQMVFSALSRFTTHALF